MEGESTPISDKLVPATNLFGLGAELLSEVQKIIGTNKVRSLRLKLGDRVIKELPVGPLTAVATILLVLIAVIVSSVSVEVEHEPASTAA
jgi:hypothetical protein